MESPSMRRPGRRAAAKRKYTEDAFEAAGLSGGSSEDGTPSKSPRVQVDDQYDISDDEFVLQEDDVVVDTAPPPDQGSNGIEEPEELADGETILEETIEESVDGGSELDSALFDASPNRRGERAVPRRQIPREATRQLGLRGPHYRGLWNPTDHVSKDLHQRLTFGADYGDKVSFVYHRDRWSKGLDVTLPSRRTLGKEYTTPSYGCGRTFGVNEADIAHESTKGWDWYYKETIGGQFRKRQKLERVGADEGNRVYIPKPKNAKHTVFLGPAQKQKAYELEQGASLSLGDAWDRMEPGKKISRKKSDNAGAEEMEGLATQENVPTEAEDSSRKVREGWVINIGQKINCLDWAPNQEDNIQYLAISTSAEQPMPDEDSEDELEAAPAFNPSEPSPASIQIWTFEAWGNDDTIQGINTKSMPALRAVICSKWGEVRQFVWCPMPRMKREEDADDAVDLGLLAGIWGDGKLRVLHVQLNKDVEGTEYLKFQDSCFAARPPSTVCTCIAWLSPSDIAVGCANGFVAVFSLANYHTNTLQPNAKPYIYAPIHLTYILNVVSAYPTHPHLLATTAMDGQTRMFSLLDPQKDVVDTSRRRIGSSHLTYSPHLRSFLSTDENDFFRLLPVRRFFTSVSACKNSSQVSAIANSSRWHPSTLGGGTDGSVIVTNPLRNMLHSKEKHYQQNWFIHEWVPAKDGSDGQTSRREASRFTDGFKAIQASLARTMTEDDKNIDGILTTTIYDEPGQVTALAWNPNYKCAGWASAGLGCGLIRVEDLAI